MECVSSQLFERFFLENFWQAAVSLRFLLLNLSVLDLLLADGLHGKPRNYCKVIIRSIKFNRTELMLLKHLSKILFTFRSQVMQKLVPAKVTITSSSKGINSALFLFCTYYSAFYVYIFGTSFGIIFIVTTIECFTDLRDPDNAVSSRNYTL